MNLEEWDKMEEESSDKTVTTEELDAAIKAYADAREDYDRKKTISNEAHHHAENMKWEVLKLLDAAKKKSYKVDGLASVSKVEKLVVKMPSGHEEKGKLFKWLNENLGAEGFLTYATINHQSLNGLYRKQFEEAAERGENFELPGVGEATTEITLQLRKGK